MERRDLALAVALAVALAASAGCYRPSYANCRVRCDSTQVCPGGLACVQGLCTTTAQCVAGDGMDGGVDLAPREQEPPLDAVDGFTPADGVESDGDDAPPDGEQPDGDASETPDGPPNTPEPPGELPGRLLDLQLWLDASVGVRDGPRFVWTDRSDRHNDARQNSQFYPTKGSDKERGELPHVHFSGGGDFLSLATGFRDFQKGLTIFVVIRLDVPMLTSPHAPILDFSEADGNAGDSIVLSRSGADDLGLALMTRVGNSSLSQSDDGVSDVLQQGKWMLLTVVLDPGVAGGASSYRIFRMGQQVGPPTQAFVPLVLPRTSNLIGRANMTGDRLRGDLPALHGDLATLIVYSRALDDSERDAMKVYLTAKWRL